VLTTCVVIPTYNEKDNIERLISALRAVDKTLRIIVVDDASPDGTSAEVERLGATLIRRAGKQGRGSAVLAGFHEGLKDPAAKAFVEMDADFSHDPNELAGTVKALDHADLVVRSRYLPGSRIVNWPPARKVFSKLANVFARALLGIPLSDYTNGYRAYSRKAVEALEFEKIVPAGYITLSATALALHEKGFKIAQLPSVFVNRRRGESNLTAREIASAFTGLLRLRFKR
jgi:dolichol-phosphate mannosyltransferase